METLVLASAIVAIAALLQWVSGFGFALILVPLLSLAWDVKSTVVLSTILSTVTLVPLVWHSRAHVRISRLRPMLLGSATGVPLGIVLFARIAPGSLQAIIGVVVITATLLVYFAPDIRPPSPDRFAPIAAGLVAGVLRGATSMGGPPATLYLLSTEHEPAVFRATMTWFLLPQGVLTVVGFLIAGRIRPEVLLVGAVSLPSLALGVVLGSTVAPYVDVRRFRSLACALLSVTAGFAILASSGLI